MINLLINYPFFAALAALILLGLGFGALLGFASIRFKTEGDPIVENINTLLPQTQCGQCGYPGCRPYAEAVANGDAINKCVPGGSATIQELADLLGREIVALDGEEKPKTIAYIREAECIGCTKCIQACPVDAIFGAAKYMHTVIASECTGCDLCVEPCPVDCIEMRPLVANIQTWHWQFPVPAEQLIASDRHAGNHRPATQESR